MSADPIANVFARTALQRQADHLRVERDALRAENGRLRDVVDRLFKPLVAFIDAQIVLDDADDRPTFDRAAVENAKADARADYDEWRGVRG